MAGELPEKVDESEFLEMSGDPAQARLLRKSLEQITRGGAGDAMTEMAREVLSGRVGLRDAVNITAYSDELLEQAAACKEEKWDALSERERDALVTDGEKVIEEQRRELDEERRGAGVVGAKSGPSARHSGSGWSPY